METVTLGASGISVPRVCVGTVTFGGHWGPMDDESAIAAVHRALDVGLSFFDTADCYGLGHAEEMLARALGPRRVEAVVSTKFGVRWDESRRTWRDISPSYMRRALDASLRRLGVDSVPMYYVHWPDGVTPIADAVGEMVRARDAGKIRAIALSNPSLDDLRAAMAVAPIAAVQVQFSLVNREVAADLLSFCEAAGIPVLTWGSLAQGLLSGRITAETRFDASDRRSRDANFQGARYERNLVAASELRRVAARIDRTPVQVALRWLLDTPGVGCALVGPKGASQVAEYVGALGWRLDPSDYEALAGLDAEPAISAR